MRPPSGKYTDSVENDGNYLNNSKELVFTLNQFLPVVEYLEVNS